MTQSRAPYKGYKKRVVIGLSIMIFVMLLSAYAFIYESKDISLEHVTIISHDEIEGLYMLNVGDEVRIKLDYEKALHKDIRYLKVNDQIYREKDIIYDMSYLEMSEDDGKRSLEIIYIVQQGDTKIEVSDVRIYFSGIIYLGGHLDLESFGYFQIFVTP